MDNKSITPLTEPLTGAHLKKVYEGSGLAYCNGVVYLLKGNNTRELRAYRTALDWWQSADSIGLGSSGKKVKGGDRLVYAPKDNALYATKGNNTVEFWHYSPLALFGLPSKAAVSHSTGRTGEGALSLAIAPNPTSNRVAISYSLPATGRVSVRLFAVAGLLTKTLATGVAQPERHALILDSSELPRGVYVLQLDTETGCTTPKSSPTVTGDDQEFRALSVLTLAANAIMIHRDQSQGR